MRLDKTDNNFVFSAESGRVKSHQALQLAHWGFEGNTEKSIFIKPEAPSTGFITKILSYLETEFGNIELGENLQKVVNNNEVQNEIFQKLKINALKYKNGKFLDNSFREFQSFTNKYLSRKLKTHQLKAAYHLYLLGSSANFSVPGSGKTSVVLSVYEKLRLENKVNMLFVVGPLSSFAAWRDEFQSTLGRKPRFQILAGGQRHFRKAHYYPSKSKLAELYLTSFQTLLHDRHEVKILLSRHGVLPFIVVDEAHYIKQIGGNWSNAVMELGKFSSKKSILTGTPFPKSYSDVFNLTDFLWPETPPFSQEVKSKIQYFEQKKRLNDARELVKGIMRPLFYRVKKKDLNLKPQIFHKPYLITMNPIEKQIYDTVKNNISAFSKQEYQRNADIMHRLKRGRMIRLRQAVSYSKLLNSALDDYREDITGQKSELVDLIRKYDSYETPAKIIRILKLIQGFKNEKVVVWSNFLGTIDLIKRTLIKNNIHAKKITGAVPVQTEKIEEEETREKIIKEFLDINKGLNVLIANPAACAESISLHRSCTKAIYYDLSYNCAQYLQSLDRIHRVGGSEIRPSDYFYLQYESTIDQDIKANLDKKTKIMNEIIDEDFKIYSLNMLEDEGDIDAYDRIFGKTPKKT